jgi:hypothetical protein
MLTLKFNNEVLGPAATFEWRRDAQADGGTECWLVTLDVEAATANALEESLATLRGQIGLQGDLALQTSGATVRQLLLANCRSGPTLARVDELDGAPGDAHGQRKLRLRFDATLQDASQAVQSHRVTISVTREAGAPLRLRTVGQAVLRRGEDPALHEAALLPAVAAGYRRVKTGSTRDAAVPSLGYEVDDEEVFSALPAGVDDGHYVVSESRDTEGRAIRTTSGFFVGAGALSAALALAPVDAGRVITQNPFTRRVDFEFRQAGADGLGSVAWIESLAFTTSRRVVDHPLLAPGAPAYRQQIGGPQTEIAQQGRAVGDGRHASPPPARYAADLVERRVRYSVPHPNLPSDRRWVTAWRYVSRTRGEALATAPETP